MLDRTFLLKTDIVMLQSMAKHLIVELDKDPKYDFKRYGYHSDFMKWDKNKIIRWLLQFNPIATSDELDEEPVINNTVEQNAIKDKEIKDLQEKIKHLEEQNKLLKNGD